MVTLLSIILGFTGSTYQTTVSALPALGVEKTEAQKLLYDLQARAVQTHHHQTTERMREHQIAPD